MTVIAYRDGVLAADRQSGAAGMIGSITKIFRVGPWLVGGSGSMAYLYEMMDWVRGGMKKAKLPDFQRDQDKFANMIFVGNEGIFLMEYSHILIPLERPYWSIGCGRSYAMGAMHRGATAIEAVETASALDTDCGQGVDVLLLLDAPTKRRKKA